MIFLQFPYFCSHFVQFLLLYLVQLFAFCSKLLVSSFCCKEFPDGIYHSHFFMFWNYTITIDVNVCNIFEMCSALFLILCTSLWILMTTINIILHISVGGTYLLYLIIEYIHSIFHLTHGRPMCFAHAFKRWI